MSERIRYARQEIGGEDYLVSCKVFETTTGQSIRVYIKEASLEYHLLDTVVSGRILEGSGSSLHKVKKKAKANLETLGVVFDKESRPGRKKRIVVSTSELLSTVE